MVFTLRPAKAFDPARAGDSTEAELGLDVDGKCAA